MRGIDSYVQAVDNVCLASKSKQHESGPENKDNMIVEMYNGGYCTNDWDKLVRKTGVLFRWRNRVKEGVCKFEREQAITFWISVAMPDTREALRKRKLSKLTLWEQSL